MTSASNFLINGSMAEENPRKHPGIIKNKFQPFPERLKHAIHEVTKDTPLKQLKKEGHAFRNYLRFRQPPMDKEDVHAKKIEIIEELKEQYPNQEIPKNILNKVLKERIYNWQPLNFNRHLGLIYLVSQSTSELAVLRRVLRELHQRTNFTPRSVFDFGSGVGSVIWAVDEIWPSLVNEFYCVDVSSDMIDLAKEIASKVFSERTCSKMFHRQFSPSPSTRKFDLVVSSHTLLELPSAASRKETLSLLWEQTSGYLVLIEKGTLHGFKILKEARNILLNEMSKSGTSSIVAPCPHHGPCPKKNLSNKSFCHFQVPFQNDICDLPLKFESFSYLVLSKEGEESKSWSRVVQPVLKRSRHVILRLCNPLGQLEETIVTPTKHGKFCYRCAKATSWGDLFPYRELDK